MRVRLYGTKGCHLCDEAKALLQQAGIPAEYVDIVHDDALLARYGMRIPVLERTDSGAELGWPFDQAEMMRFLAG